MVGCEDGVRPVDLRLLCSPPNDGLLRAEFVPTTGNVRNALQGRRLGAQLEGKAIATSQEHLFFHWPLEFPDVF